MKESIKEEWKEIRKGRGEERRKDIYLGR